LPIRHLVKPRNFHWCYRGEPRNFICVAAVNRGIYEIHRGICQNSAGKRALVITDPRQRSMQMM